MTASYERFERWLDAGRPAAAEPAARARAALGSAAVRDVRGRGGSARACGRVPVAHRARPDRARRPDGAPVGLLAALPLVRVAGPAAPRARSLTRARPPVDTLRGRTLR